MVMQQPCIYINQKNIKEKLEASIGYFFLYLKKVANHLFFFIIKNQIDYVKKYATEDALREQEEESDSSESTMSDFSDDETKDMEL